MTKKEFEIWYLDKLKPYKGGSNWLEYKAKFLISKTILPFEEVNELVSITLESLLESIEILKPETLDGYCFFTMRNCMYNKLLYPNKKVCCEGDFENYNIESEEYNLEIDANIEKKIKEIENKAQTHEELLIFTALMEGTPLKETGLNGKKITNITRKFKGLESYKPKNCNKKKTGGKKGRPKLNKTKEKKMRSYKGVAKLGENGEILKVYESANCVYIDGYSRESVSKCCNGKLKLHKGFKFVFVKDIKANENL